MARNIILLFTCDVWSSNASMSPYWVGGNINKFFQAVRRGIKDGDFEYGAQNRPIFLMLEEFDEDLRTNKTYLWDCIFNQKSSLTVT